MYLAKTRSLDEALDGLVVDVAHTHPRNHEEHTRPLCARVHVHLYMCIFLIMMKTQHTHSAEPTKNPCVCEYVCVYKCEYICIHMMKT